MKKFLGDMFIGWILFTDSGKKAANKVVNIAYKQVKKNVLKSSQFQEILALKDIFLNVDGDEDENGEKSNDRTKD